MEKFQFKNILDEINKEIEHNKTEINKAIQEEVSKKININLNKIIELINSYNDVEIPEPENKSIAVTYSGNLEIAITYMIDSILHNNKLVLCANGSKNINELMYNIFSQSLAGCKLKNQWLDYNSNYNEILLKENQDKFDKIVYVGDYFEYKRFQTSFKKEVEYSNYGNIKLFIDKSMYKEEYDKMIRFAYENNVSLEIYDDVKDFMDESRKEDFSVIFADFNLINQLQKGLKSEEILINTFPYDSYKFKIER